MREDMFKVIVERPRWGSRHATKSKLRYDRCEGRSRVTGKRLVSEVGYTKHLNENLAPLRRYLHKQVGRRWDDVFSDICQQLDTGSTVKMHVREHLDDFVKRQVRREADGFLWSLGRWSGETKIIDSRVELYVDPDDGILKRTKALCKKRGVVFMRDRWKLRKSSCAYLQACIRKIGDLQWHVKLDGIWYHIQISEPPRMKAGYPLSLDAFYKALQENTWRDHTRWDVVSKRQLSHRQLKAHDLQNNYKEMERYFG